MKMFIFKSFCLFSLLFIAVLTGMQMANNGIQKMKGYEDPQKNNVISLQGEDQNQHAAILENDLSSHDMNAKKKKLEELSAVNFFSSIGRKMSDGLTNASAKMIDQITK
ncbi:DUF3679 domain-containing protein [Bacillus sp. BRMEA1]|uniref:DUF3679 domain-containing protein n=1 Tax=Neobacillus endophyticus TaxID=2738405 RepID=UPI001567055E|nr:DUF3679 domain-containing protein [Neobacillus endophyticus]NRD75895.1 DUF3679 domain-containing protein [Neobacillus endophyticus]